jgi:DNA polymerase elongation subunit (family B)
MGKKASDVHEIVAKIKAMAKELGKTPTLREFMEVVSRRQIDKHGWNNLLKMAGLDLNFTPNIEHTIDVRPPKVLLFDIETSACVAHVWGGYEQNIGANQVIQDWYVLSWAAKWMGEDEIFYQDIRKYKNGEDHKILPGIHKLICEADFVVGHNSDKFDIKKLNARFLKHGMPPLSPYRSIDTLKIARKYFKLTFNTLSYIAKYLGLKEQKSEHKKFSGMDLWNACMGKDKKLRLEAFEEMELYNKQDVVVLEGILTKLMPYDPSIKFSSFYQQDACSCGGKVFIKDGLWYMPRGAFQRYKCKGCGKVFKDRKNLINKDVRKELMS